MGLSTVLLCYFCALLTAGRSFKSSSLPFSIELLMKSQVICVRIKRAFCSLLRVFVSACNCWEECENTNLKAQSTTANIEYNMQNKPTFKASHDWQVVMSNLELAVWEKEDSKGWSRAGVLCLVNQTVGVGRFPQSRSGGSAGIVNAYCKLSEDKTKFLALPLTFGTGHQDTCTQPCV